MNTPRLARWLIHIGAPDDRRDELLGDLEEVHRRRQENGVVLAGCASTADALIVAFALAGARLRDSLARRRRRSSWMNKGDFKTGVRQMWRSPVMTVTATMALALGIGLLAVGAATVDTLLFSRLPFEGGDRFVLVRTLETPVQRPISLTPEAYAQMATGTTALEHIGAATQSRQNITLPSGAVETVMTAGITPGLLPRLPYQPTRGRQLTSADAEPGADLVLVIREAFWFRAFGGAEDAIGATIEVGGRPHTVVGIMPNEFEFPNSPPALWTPIDESFREGRVAPPANARLIGVLAADHSLESAQAQLDVLAARMTAPGTGGRVRLEAASMTDLGPQAPIIASALIATVVALLLVVAANVANLVLARSYARSRELAVRAALGASRARLIGQMIAELLPLCGVAAVIGVVAAQSIVLRFNAIDDFPFWVTFSVGPRTLAFVVCGTLLATGVAAAWPALRVTHGDLGAALPSGGRVGDASFGRVAGAIIVVQIAVSVVMLHGALIVADGANRYLNGNTVLPPSVLTAGVFDAGTATDSSNIVRPSAEEIEEIASVLPGVIAAGLSTSLPRHSPPTRLIEIEPLPGESPRQLRQAPSAEVSPNFFGALAGSALAGRLLTEADGRDGASPVAVVNAPFVETFLGGAQAVGRRFRTVDANGAANWREIVGVVPDLGLSIGDPAVAAGYYIPLDSGRDQARFIYLAMRVAGDPSSYIDLLTQAVYDRDPNVVLNQPQPLEDVASDDRLFFLWFSRALTAIGIVTLILALAGVYAMMALIVTKRTREIGIRIAMGATARRVVQTVLRRAAWQVGAGALLGAGLAVLSLDLRGVLVSRLPDGGPWTLPAVLVLLTMAGIAATAAPLRRAVSVQPSEAMRVD
jgi:predicted permease